VKNTARVTSPRDSEASYSIADDGGLASKLSFMYGESNVNKGLDFKNTLSKMNSH